MRRRVHEAEAAGDPSCNPRIARRVCGTPLRGSRLLTRGTGRSKLGKSVLSPGRPANGLPRGPPAGTPAAQDTPAGWAAGGPKPGSGGRGGMTAAATWGAGFSAARTRRRGPAGRGGAASRRRSLALLIVLAALAGLAGAAVGVVKQPDPGGRAEEFARTAGTAVAVAQGAEMRARAAEARAAEAERQLSAVRARLATLSTTGAEQ